MRPLAAGESIAALMTARPADAIRLLARARSTTLSLDAPQRPIDPADPDVISTLEGALVRQDATLALELAAAMRYVWLSTAAEQGIVFITRALDLPACTPDVLRAEALNALGMLLGQTGRADESRAALTESVEIHRRVGSGPELARALSNLGIALQLAGDAEGSERTLTDAVAVARASGQQRTEVIALHELGAAAIGRGDLRAARGYVEDALRAAIAIDDRGGLHATYDTLGSIALLEGRRDDALAHYALSLREHLRSLPVPEVAHAFMGVAILAAEAGDLETAARLTGATAAIAAAGMLPNAGLDARYAETLTRLDALGPEERARLEREGAALDHTAVIRLALEHLERGR